MLSLFPSIIIKLYYKCYHYFQSYQSHQNVPDGTGVGEAGCRGGPCWNLSSSTFSWTVLGYNYLKLVGGPYWKRWNDTSPLRLQVPMFHCQECCCKRAYDCTNINILKHATHAANMCATKPNHYSKTCVHMYVLSLNTETLLKHKTRTFVVQLNN